MVHLGIFFKVTICAQWNVLAAVLKMNVTLRNACAFIGCKSTVSVQWVWQGANLWQTSHWAASIQGAIHEIGHFKQGRCFCITTLCCTQPSQVHNPQWAKKCTNFHIQCVSVESCKKHAVISWADTLYSCLVQLWKPASQMRNMFY